MSSFRCFENLSIFKEIPLMDWYTERSNQSH